MATRKTPAIEESLSPNLIPMIDIMFLLLLFFMLGADMSQRELAGELILPEAAMVPEDPRTRDGGDTTINIHHETEDDSACAVFASGGICREGSHWRSSIRGKSLGADALEAQLAIEAATSMESAPDPVAKRVLSARNVLIRADAAAPYGDVQKGIELCGSVGIHKVEVAAARPTSARK